MERDRRYVVMRVAMSGRLRASALACIAPACIALAPLSLVAQPPARDTSARAVGRPWTVQEVADACNHLPGARMRLYGCRPEAYGPRVPEPVYVIDGRVLPTDTMGPGRATREAALEAIESKGIHEITPVVSLRNGTRAVRDTIRIRTKEGHTRDSVFAAQRAERAHSCEALRSPFFRRQVERVASLTPGRTWSAGC